jgi:hypothetical protein
MDLRGGPEHIIYPEEGPGKSEGQSPCNFETADG